MSRRYQGAIISATPPTTSTESASGSWTLQQQMQAQAAGNWPSGLFYIEDVFSTYLYTGNGSTQTITNGIDLSGEGGLVWIKNRVTGTTNHVLTDTVRGANASLASNSTAAQSPAADEITGFTSSGFSVGAGNVVNESAKQIASWTFRKQPKFFDIQTWTGNDVNGRTISHSLGSTPGCIIIKNTTSATSWVVSHRSIAAPETLKLNDTAAANNYDNGVTSITSTSFNVSSDVGSNASGSTYVAYIFAHDAGGFGFTGTENVISCGSYVGNAATNGPTVTLGYEPQWLLIKDTTNADNWCIQDSTRGITNTPNNQTSQLYPNLTNADNLNTRIANSATGFQVIDTGGYINTSGATYIYVAIRRGPMKTPTDATTVFQPVAYTGTNVDNRLVTTGILTDMTLARIRSATSTGGIYSASRLTGNYSLGTAITAVQNNDSDSFMTPTVGYGISFSAMNGFGVGNDVTRQLNQSSTNQIAYAFQRAPGFFDEVCYIGTGTSGATFAHSLGVAPELMIVKGRDAITDWSVYSAALGATNVVYLNSTAASAASSGTWNDTAPTSSLFTLGNGGNTNESAKTFVAYLFATLAGISKVGSYTGTGATQTIDCGFAGGARFVLIKRTDNPGDWYVWDTARGMTSGTDPSLKANTTAAEVNANSIYTTTGGFQIVSTASGINGVGESFIYLAIA